MSLGGSGVSIGGVGSLRVGEISQPISESEVGNHMGYTLDLPPTQDASGK